MLLKGVARTEKEVSTTPFLRIIMKNNNRVEDCKGCNCYLAPNGKSDKICNLVKRKYYKYISEKCPCQLCLVKVTCHSQQICVERFLPDAKCNKFSNYFISVFRWGIVKHNKIRNKEFVVRNKVKIRFKHMELIEKNEIQKKSSGRM
jgi:hypothetical protein